MQADVLTLRNLSLCGEFLAAINDCHIIGGKNNFESLFTLNIENVAR